MTARAASLAAGFAALAACLAACPGPPVKPPAPPSEPGAAGDDRATVARLLTELQDDVLASYERDEPPELESGMIDPRVGTARIGAGPGDVYIASDQARAPSRWPLDVDRGTRTAVRSKRLEVQLAADRSAAWVSDEVSWRIAVCGRTAVIPLRITALYAHDGDRWVPVFEHLSFAQAPAQLVSPDPKEITTAVVSGDLRDELSGVVSRGLLRAPHDATVLAQESTALVLGPEASDEWRGPQVINAALPGGRLEERRVGTVGRSLRQSTVAYWIGTYLADVPARPGVDAHKVRMRVTFVFERRARWVLVQSHMSQAITDPDLASLVFGTAASATKPLSFTCAGGR